jgi:hypothetical protein
MCCEREACLTQAIFAVKYLDPPLVAGCSA